MKSQCETQENSPQQHIPTAEYKQHHAYHCEGNIVVGIEPTVIPIFYQIGRVASEGFLAMILCRAPQNPTNVGPPAAIARRVRVACFICVCVVYPVRHYPLNRSAFERHRAAGHQKVFDRFRHFITAVSEQPVPTHADAKTSTDPVKDERGYHRGPTPEPES